MNKQQASPLGRLFAQIIAENEADRAIDFARLQAIASNSAARQMRADAMKHAAACIETCDAQGIEYDEETLSHNIESNFPDLDLDACDEIASTAIAKAAA